MAYGTGQSIMITTLKPYYFSRYIYRVPTILTYDAGMMNSYCQRVHVENGVMPYKFCYCRPCFCKSLCATTTTAHYSGACFVVTTRMGAMYQILRLVLSCPALAKQGGFGITVNVEGGGHNAWFLRVPSLLNSCHHDASLLSLRSHVSKKLYVFYQTLAGELRRPAGCLCCHAPVYNLMIN